MDGTQSPNSMFNLPKFHEEKKKQDFERSRENFLRTSLTKSQRLRGLADKIKSDSTRASFDNRGFAKDDGAINKDTGDEEEDKRKTREITDIHKTPVAGCYWTEIESNNGVKLKRIILHKPANCHLGITVKNVGASIIINRIMKGGMSDISEVFTEGDELVALNGQELVSEDVDYIHDVFSEQSNQLELIVLPSRDMFAKMTKSLTNESSIYLRSLFSYDPESDVYLPCKDVGLAFTKGGIIEVRSIKDSFWWQAYRLEAGNVREGPIDSRLCGLIPSPQYQYNRTIARILTGGLMDEFEVTNGYLDEEFSKDPTFNIINAFSTHNEFVWMKNGGAAYTIYKERCKGLPEVIDLSRESLDIWCRSGIIWGQLGYSLSDMHSGKKGTRQNKSKANNDKLKFTSGQDADDPVAWLDEDEIIHSINRPCLFTYEPVVEFYPQPQRRRILVIVGSALVGKMQVIEKLIDYDSRRFVLPKIVTTCDSINLNTPNQKYEVISQGTFEAMFREDAFVEIGYFNKCFYGILKSTLEEIVKMGRVAVVNLRPESLRRMRKTGLLPYVVCLSPPNSGNELRRSRSIFDPTYTCSMEELKYCIESNMFYETMYGHWYDYVEPVYDIEESVKTIHEVVIRLEREKQWIPRHWLNMARGLAYKNKIEYAASKIFNTDISVV